MKNHFNAKRFSLLFQKHTAENYKTYLMALLVLVGAMLLILSTASYLAGSPPNLNAQAAFFVFFLLAAGTIFTSSVFASLGDSKRAISFLTLPASTLEKYLVAWLYSFLFFSLLYIPAFYLVDYLVVGLDWRTSGQAPILNVFEKEKALYYVFLLYAFLHAFTLVGAILFRKGHFIKIAAIGLVAFFIVVLLNKQVLQVMLGPEVQSAVPFDMVTLEESKQYFQLDVSEAWSVGKWLVPVALALITWAAAYFKLKEKQV